MNRRSSTCDALVPRDRKDPPDKTMGSDARQHSQEVISGRTTSGIIHSHDDLAAFLLPMPKLDTDPPSTSLRVSPARPKDIHQWPHQDAINTKMTSTFWRSPEVSVAVPIPTLEQRGYTVFSQAKKPL
ncbi:hypothetical protein AX14_011249 [Amanita brunnescens Koide BX004]|nr:hypothetical protein AX14_011249 [Amanita brunnescens Koide BX004]